MSKPVPPSKQRKTAKKTVRPSTPRDSPKASEHLALELSILESENALKRGTKDSAETEAGQEEG